MNVTLNGERVTVPLCTCGKCILRRNHDLNSVLKYPYPKNLSSTYNAEHNRKPLKNSCDFFNRSKQNNFDNCYREHLPSLLMSTMKFDYKPFKVKFDPSRVEKTPIESIPFYGRSSYRVSYPGWEPPSKSTDRTGKLPFIKVPFRGNSNYLENYKKFDTEALKNKYPIMKPYDNLDFKGKIQNDSLMRDSYGNPYANRTFHAEKPKKADQEKSILIPADYPKEYASTYRNFFKDRGNEYCELAQFLKKSGLKNLVL